MRAVLALILGLLSCCTAASPAPPNAPATPAAGSSDPALGWTGAGGAAERPAHAQASVPVSLEDPQWGDVDAPVTIVELSDFECPFCSRVQPTLESLKRTYGPQQLRLVWKHSPLPFHPDARPTHEVAAAVQMLAGSKAFYVFHDLAFANQSALTRANLEAWAARAGVERTALQTWLDSGKPAQKVDADLELAVKLGARGTPAFRINGVVVSGAQPLEVFTKVVSEQLLAAKQLVQAGTAPRDVYPLLTAQNFTAPSPPEPAADAKDEEDLKVWNVPVQPGDPVRGPADALVTIVEFSDFECPFCKRADDTLAKLLELYPKEVRLVWKDNPLPFHARAMPAAKFGRFAYQTKGNEGFWKAHDALFGSQAQLDEDALRDLAKNQGLAWPRLKAALDDVKLPAKIEESQELASDFQARGTPHFFVNGRRLVGAQPLAKFTALVDEQLIKARELVASGVPRSKVFAELMKSAEQPTPPERRSLALREGAASRGNAKAPVVIQEFSDFQCPFCSRVEPTLAQLERDFKGSIRIVWRHLPLPFHQYAEPAAEASEEVLAQKGEAGFWSYHGLLFQAQSEPDGLSRENLSRMALSLGVDLKRFDAALDGHIHLAKVKADAAAAESVELHGTPSFLINDYVLTGAQPAAAFSKLIKRALKERAKP